METGAHESLLLLRVGGSCAHSNKTSVCHHPSVCHQTLHRQPRTHTPNPPTLPTLHRHPLLTPTLRAVRRRTRSASGSAAMNCRRLEGSAHTSCHSSSSVSRELSTWGGGGRGWVGVGRGVKGVGWWWKGEFQHVREQAPTQHVCVCGEDGGGMGGVGGGGEGEKTA